ncbi:MAG: tRNA dihydrouridine synthase DusB [Candidatus Omnitrophica bacterium]|nr:tRNA dihydrouridine synthase DusB [Candidatus Omnitrophota bacterium]
MDTKIYLAPMAGVTDLAFRLVSRSLGASQCFFEMLDSRALLYEHPRNRRLLKTLKDDSPIAAQLVGVDPAVMLDAAQKLITLVDISFLDINSACPAKKIIKKGAGAALSENTARLGKIIKTLSSKLPVPVTVKLRTGFRERNVKKFVKVAKTCQESGASVLFIHGRTMSQGYSGGIDYESIGSAKKALKIPVFGSGDILDPILAKKMLDETGCDGILAARGALGNPWIFKNIERYLTTGETTENPTIPEKKKILKTHLAYIEKYKDMAFGNKVGFMGKVTMWYLKGIPNAARARARISGIRSYEGLVDLINEVYPVPNRLSNLIPKSDFDI